MSIEHSPIGFFDSGVGGLSVLKEAVKLMPKENYIYFGDSKNAPYGVKTVNEVKELSFKAVEFLMEKNIKALVVACNTATSAAVEDIRSSYKGIPVIGIEPALKPAVLLGKEGNIIIMATPMTLAEKKFNRLMGQYSDKVTIQTLPCPELVRLIENGVIEGREMNDYLYGKLKPYMNNTIAAIVLGCTHYPFVKKSITNLVGDDIPVIDGGIGTVKQLHRQLMNKSLINDSVGDGKVEIYNSLNDKSIIELSYKLLSY